MFPYINQVITSYRIDRPQCLRAGHGETAASHMMGFEQQGRCNGAGPVPFWLQGIPSSPRARKAKGRYGGIVTDSMKMVYIYPVIFQKMPKLPAATDWGSKFHHSLKLFAKI